MLTTELCWQHSCCCMQTILSLPHSFCPLTPPSPHRLNQHTGPPSVALQWHHLKFALVTQPMHHRQRAVSPNDRARRCRVGGNLNLKQPGWLKWKNCRWEKKRRRRKHFDSWNLRGNRHNKSNDAHGASLKCYLGLWFGLGHLKYICVHRGLWEDQHVKMKHKVKELELGVTT